MHGGHAADALASVGYSSSAVQLASLSDSAADDKTPTGSFFHTLSLQLPSLWQSDSPVTGSYFLEPTFKYVLLFVCDWMPLSRSRSWT